MAQLVNMAMNARKSFIMGTLNVKFENYTELMSPLSTAESQNISVCSISTNNNRLTCSPYISDCRYDIIMTGNMCDIYGLHETLNSVKMYLKLPSEYSKAYILKLCSLHSTYFLNGCCLMDKKSSIKSQNDRGDFFNGISSLNYFQGGHQLQLRGW